MTGAELRAVTNTTGALDFKVYVKGEYVAACKYAQDATALVAIRGDGAQIKYGHRRVVWTEGKETQSAAASYDFVYETIHGRIKALAF
jgi:hypothetical protein